MKKKALMILSIFLILSCAACGGAAKSDSMKIEQSMGTANNYAMSYGSEGSDMAMAETSAKISEDTATVQDGRKLIKEVDMSIETKRFDAFVSNLEAEVQRVGGIHREDVPRW